MEAFPVKELPGSQVYFHLVTSANAHRPLLVIAVVSPALPLGVSGSISDAISGCVPDSVSGSVFSGADTS